MNTRTVPPYHSGGGTTVGISLCALLLALLPAPSPAQTPTVTKLLGRATTPQAFNQFGQAVAVSDRFLLVGEPGNNDKGLDAGAAHLFDARNGRYLRKLTAKDAAAGSGFGSSVALSGHLALIGADRDSNKGAAYLFDARTGKQLRKFTDADGEAFDFFGISVALSGNLAFVGAYGDDGYKGAAYLFDARAGGPYLHKLTAADGEASDFFGISVALSGNLALIGAYGDDSFKGAAYVFDARSGAALATGHAIPGKLTASDGVVSDGFGISVALSGHLALVGAWGDDSKGAAYLFDARNGAALATGHAVPGKLTAADAAVGDNFGVSVALSGHLALVGAYGDDGFKGAAYLFDARSGAALATGHAIPGKLTVADGAANDQFSYDVALSGNLALISARGDDDNGAESGSAYFIRPLAAPLPLARVATKGASAPGTGGATFAAFPQAFINPDGEAVLHATLSGPAASGGRNRGVWDNLSGSLARALRLKDTDLGGAKASKIVNAWGNHASNALIQAVLGGPGVNAGNNQAVYRDNGASLMQIARTGTEPAGGIFGGAAPQSFPQVVQSGQDRVALNTLLKKGGAGGVTAANDSSLFFANHMGAPIGSVFREGISAVSGGGMLGQLFSRVAESRGSHFIGFGAAVVPAGGGAALQAVFSPFHASAALNPIAMQGEDAPGIGPPTVQYRAFLGETLSSNGLLIWRVSLRGKGVTSKNNEGIWHQAGDPDPLIARKGQEVDPVGLPGVKIARFLGFWPANDNLQEALLLVKLSGSKVSGASDVALLLWDQTVPNALQVLLREGQLVEGADAPAVRVIQRVDVEPATGHYVVLCSLTGAAARNQALFTGLSTLGDAAGQKAKRLPGMKLRKGILYKLPAVTTTARLRSLSLPVTTDQTGAGGKGLGQVINSDGEMVLTLDFDNKAREVLSGVP